MFNLSNIFGNKNKDNKDKIASLLRTNPEALEAFEKAYAKSSIDDNDMPVNAKQMAKRMHQESHSSEAVSEIKDRIVEELVHGTKVFSYTMNHGSSSSETKEITITSNKLPTTFVSKEEILSLPENLRPELAGELMKKDVGGDSYEVLLTTYVNMLEERNIAKKSHLYHVFRQGLDILDIDPVIYEMLSLNPNSMGNWLPEIIPAVEKEGFFSIPNTKIVKVPITMLQLTRLDYMSHTRTTLDIVDEWAKRVFELDENKHYFIKTGTYSSKFDFRNAKITDPKEVSEIGEYLLFIHSDAISMAHYDVHGIGKPVIYGVSTTNEWVVREFIEDEDNEQFTIYHGLPLHTEYRVFVDFDSRKVLGIHAYWDSEVMKKRFGDAPDANTPDMIHDYVTYTAQEDKLMQRFNENKDTVVQHIQSLLSDVNLHGQWSIDIMQNGNKFWLIDMATADTSAFYKETVPEELRCKTPENWIPDIGSKIKRLE